jgi:hypothetical protein
MTLDKIGGKPLTMTVLTVIIAPYVYRSFSKLIKGEIDIVKKIPLRKGDIFKIKRKDIHVTKVISTSNGYCGNGWYETGIVNIVKVEIEFKDVEIDEDYNSLKGEVLSSSIPEYTADFTTKDKTEVEKPISHYDCCPACGYTLKDTDKECPDCGLNLS